MLSHWRKQILQSFPPALHDGQWEDAAWTLPANNSNNHHLHFPINHLFHGGAEE